MRVIKKRKAYVFKERQRYSIRKYSFGATSVFIGASLMLGGHVLAQEQANSVSSSKDYEVIVNLSRQLRKLLPMFSMNLCQNRKHQDLILPAVKLLLFLNQRWLAHVLKRRQWLVQKWQVKLTVQRLQKLLKLDLLTVKLSILVFGLSQLMLVILVQMV